MDARKKLDAKIEDSKESTSDQQLAFIEGWEGQLPTKPWPTTGKLLVQADEDDEKNVEWFYNSSRQQYGYLSNYKNPKKHPDYSKSVVDLYDSSDEEDISDEQTKKNEDSRAISHTQSSMFSAPTKALAANQSSKKTEEYTSNLKRKRP